MAPHEAMLAFGGTVCTGFAAYLLFAGTLSMSEMLTGTVLGMATAVWMRMVARVSRRAFAFEPAQLRAIARAIAGVPRQTVRTAVALPGAILRPDESPGRPDDVPFRHGASADPQERGRRATALLAASLAPAGYVVQARPGDDRALIHSIGGAPTKTDREWLV